MQGEEKSEAELMYDYLRYNGVRPDQMLMEKRSASTVENVAFSRLVIEQDRLARKRKREALFQPVGPGVEPLAPDKPDVYKRQPWSRGSLPGNLQRSWRRFPSSAPISTCPSRAAATPP